MYLCEDVSAFRQELDVNFQYETAPVGFCLHIRVWGHWRQFDWIIGAVYHPGLV
eukprot:m.6340 g.6340  ORF g.6340 m.6340 type:complete len:54 (+) comp8403_c0_seq1:46-207(+)